MTTPTRPIVRYHGGKWMLAPWILSHFPHHRIYVEPFGGGGSVLLRKERSYAEVYNDLDEELVNLFIVTRDHGAELIRLLELTPFSRKEFVQSYEPTDDRVERARRTVIKAFMGFGSNAIHRITGFRSNSHRSGTTPAWDWKNYPEALQYIVDRLRGVAIENRDAMELIPTHDSKRTLFYCDPPYVLGTRGNTAKDYEFELSDRQHYDLAALLHTVKGMVVVSGYPSTLYDDELYADWHRVECQALADGARKRVEVLWLNPAATAALNHDLFSEIR